MTVGVVVVVNVVKLPVTDALLGWEIIIHAVATTG